MKNDWIECELQEIGIITSGGTPSTTNDAFWGGEISWITPADLSKYSEKYISKGRKSITKLGLQKSSARLIPKHSVLFSSRAPIGYTVIAANELCTNQGFKNITPCSGIDFNFVYYFLKSSKQKAELKASGTTFKELSGKNFSELQIPLAPLPIQRAIVSKIEAMFSDLDNGIANLKKAKEQLKIYRQAVLKKAFEGKFTNENVVEGELPKGWKWVKLGEVADITSSKRIFQNDYVSEGIPFYRTKEIKELSEGKKLTFDLFISEEKYEEIKTKFPIPKQGDILLSAVGTIGVSYIVKDEKPFYFKDGNLMWFKNLNGIIPQFLSYGLTSFIRHKNEAKTSGSAYSALTIETMKRFKFPIPPTIEEQTQIVQEIERRLSVCDKMEQSLKESIAKAEALRQSILKKAFEGKLLSQTEIAQCQKEPDYEPASELLKKIKAEKIKTEKLAKEQKNTKTDKSNTNKSKIDKANANKPKTDKPKTNKPKTNKPKTKK